MFWTGLIHSLRLGLRNIAAHRLRSSLTALGMVLGTASVIVMLAVGEAARYEAVEQIKQLGATNLILRSVKPTDDGRQSAARRLLVSYGLTWADLERIRSTIPTVASATPTREFRKEARFRERRVDARIVAVTPDYPVLNSLRVERGRFLTDEDDRTFANVVVLGAEAAAQLFPREDPLGQSVRLGGSHFYRVVGVTERRSPTAGVGSSLAAQDYNLDAYIPFSTDRVRFGKMLVSIQAGSIQAEQLEISQITIGVHRLEEVRATAQLLQSMVDQFHPKQDVVLTVPLDLLERAEQTQRLFTMVLGAIASIALLVGGIGIMNIMLATVTERTREIGIRRALGAKRRDILRQFLVETMVLSTAGGVLGVLLGVVSALVITRLAELPTIIQLWSPLVSLGVSLGVGLVFGVYPARRAAYMDPIEAIRHE
ncbi:MAG TPA: ABC transporter permease [Gemmatales bacterium]|nr:ABC transporter permease [Gemmatales bacterium]HMP60903.1 ABC transporter permease [Gemmatales bacterium]